MSGAAFLVVTRGPIDRAETVPLVKPLRLDIRLEGPEPQAPGLRTLCQPDQLTADAVPGQSGFDVELIEPVLIENHEADERSAIVLGHPKLGVRDDVLRNPPPHFVIGVDGHRDRLLRSLAGAEVERRHRNCIPVGSPSKFEVHPIMIPVSLPRGRPNLAWTSCGPAMGAGRQKRSELLICCRPETGVRVDGLHTG